MSNKLSVKERHISFAAQLKNLRTGREKIDLKKKQTAIPMRLHQYHGFFLVRITGLEPARFPNGF